MTNAAMVRSKNAGSEKGVTKSASLNFLRDGGSRDLMVQLPTTRRPRKRNAVARIAQPKPTRTTRRSTMIGRTTPPMLEPAVIMPNARARCLRNHVPSAVMAARCSVSFPCG